MEVRISKRCYECGYIELMETVDRSLIVAFNLTISDEPNINLICHRCMRETIRLDIDVSEKAHQTTG